MVDIKKLHSEMTPQPEWLGLPLDHEVMLTDEEEKMRRPPPMYVEEPSLLIEISKWMALILALCLVGGIGFLIVMMW